MSPKDYAYAVRDQEMCDGEMWYSVWLSNRVETWLVKNYTRYKDYFWVNNTSTVDVSEEVLIMIKLTF